MRQKGSNIQWVTSRNQHHSTRTYILELAICNVPVTTSSRVDDKLVTNEQGPFKYRISHFVVWSYRRRKSGVEGIFRLHLARRLSTAIEAPHIIFQTYNTQIGGLDTLRDLAMRRLIKYWTLIKLSQWFALYVLIVNMMVSINIICLMKWMVNNVAVIWKPNLSIFIKVRKMVTFYNSCANLEILFM